MQQEFACGSLIEKKRLVSETTGLYPIVADTIYVFIFCKLSATKQVPGVVSDMRTKKNDMKTISAPIRVDRHRCSIRVSIDGRT